MLKPMQNVIEVGVKNSQIKLFEGQYAVDGMTYNSYLIKDEKNTLLDTVDKCVIEEWLKNVENALNGEKLDYLIISHLEPDHSAGIIEIINKYPEVKIVSNQKVFAFLPQFADIPDLEERKIEVKENDSLSLGNHTLKFIMAPMVHWPEVMMEYEETEKILFSADAFGKFGDCMKEDNYKSAEEAWLSEARRYYINIVGKYGIQVQALLKKAEALDIKTICPLHGTVIKENLGYYIQKYQTWSEYKPEKNGILIVCASPHGHTLEAVQELKEKLIAKNIGDIELIDLTREDMTNAVAMAFCYPIMIVASTTYNAELFPAMDQFLRLLKMKNYQERKVGIIENGTWAPMAAKHMKELLESMKNIEILERVITIHTKLDEKTRDEMEKLCDELI